MHLQIAVALIFFTNKVMVLIGKKVGWLVGAFAGVLAIWYFYLLEYYVYTTLEFGLVALMLYGFLTGEKKAEKTEKFVHILIIVVMTVFTYFVFTGMLTILEFISSSLLLLGTYYLLHEKVALGWTLYVFAHATCSYLGYEKNQDFFADFQIASAIVSAVGVYKSLRK